MSNQIDDPFMTSSAPALKFAEIGETHAITVRKVDQKVDTDLDGEIKTWPNGDPMHVFVFNGESETGEPVALWVRGNMVKAIREATTKAGLPSVINAKVTVRFTALGEDKGKGKKPAKLFAAKVEAAAPPAAADPFSDDDEPF